MNQESIMEKEVEGTSLNKALIIEKNPIIYGIIASLAIITLTFCALVYCVETKKAVNA